MSQDKPQEVAFVVYDGLTPLDLVGPVQVFSALTLFTPEYRPVVVGASKEPVATDCPFAIVPEKTFSEVPDPFLLIVPGGTAPTLRALADQSLIEYVKSVAETAAMVGSVCTGSLILAAAGLLDGRRATTHWSFAKQLERLGASYVPERWVEDGRVITTAGISAGIDGALYLVEKLAGAEVARQVQLVLEYDPRPPHGGIDWTGVDRGMLDPVVDGWIADALADQPELAARLTGSLR